MSNSLEGKVLLPGDSIDLAPLSAASSKSRPILFGHGLVRGTDSLLVSHPGVLRLDRKTSKLLVEGIHKRYSPSINDNVIGVIRGPMLGEFWRVDIGDTREAILPFLAFDGATKRTRPVFETGDLVYAHVVQYSHELGAELSCKAKDGIAPKSWATGESVYGLLSKGTLFNIPQRGCKDLLEDNCRVLEGMRGKAFELAVGDNGRVWVKSTSIKDTLVIRQKILKAYV